MQTESVRLAHIRALLAAIAPGDWRLVADGDGMFVEVRAEMGELLTMMRFTPEASPEEMELAARAPSTIRFLLDLVDRAIAAAKRSQPAEPAQQPDRPGNYAAEAAMKCAEPAFRVFLEERHGLARPLTDERVAQKVRSLCGVTSRRELNDAGEAAARWRSLVRDFETWRRAG